MNKYTLSSSNIYENLRKYFAHDEFKSKLQKDAIEEIVKGR